MPSPEKKSISPDRSLTDMREFSLAFRQAKDFCRNTSRSEEIAGALAAQGAPVPEGVRFDGGMRRAGDSLIVSEIAVRALHTSLEVVRVLEIGCGPTLQDDPETRYGGPHLSRILANIGKRIDVTATDWEARVDQNIEREVFHLKTALGVDFEKLAEHFPGKPFNVIFGRCLYPSDYEEVTRITPGIAGALAPQGCAILHFDNLTREDGTQSSDHLVIIGTQLSRPEHRDQITELLKPSQR